MLQDVVDYGTASAVRSMGLRAPARRKDRDHQRVQGRVVRRVLDLGGGGGLDRLRPAAADRARRLRGARGAAGLGRLHAPRRRSRPRSSSPPATLEDVSLCRISYLRPVDGCPIYTEYFKEGDAIPKQMCPVHRGNLKQQARRVLDDLLRGVGRRIRDIFR